MDSSVESRPLHIAMFQSTKPCSHKFILNFLLINRNLFGVDKHLYYDP